MIPNPISPGIYTVHDNTRPIYRVNTDDKAPGLEALAEDGDIRRHRGIRGVGDLDEIVMAALDADPQQVWLAGFSQGGAIALHQGKPAWRRTCPSRSGQTAPRVCATVTTSS